MLKLGRELTKKRSVALSALTPPSEFWPAGWGGARHKYRARPGRARGWARRGGKAPSARPGASLRPPRWVQRRDRPSRSAYHRASSHFSGRNAGCEEWRGAVVTLRPLSPPRLRAPRRGRIQAAATSSRQPSRALRRGGRSRDPFSAIRRSASRELERCALRRLLPRPRRGSVPLTVRVRGWGKWVPARMGLTPPRPGFVADAEPSLDDVGFCGGGRSNVSGPRRGRGLWVNLNLQLWILSLWLFFLFPRLWRYVKHLLAVALAFNCRMAPRLNILCAAFLSTGSSLRGRIDSPSGEHLSFTLNSVRDQLCCHCPLADSFFPPLPILLRSDGRPHLPTDRLTALVLGAAPRLSLPAF